MLYAATLTYEEALAQVMSGNNKSVSAKITNTTALIKRRSLV